MQRLSVILGVLLIFLIALIAIELLVRFLIAPQFENPSDEWMTARYIIEPVLAAAISCAWVWWTAGGRKESK